MPTLENKFHQISSLAPRALRPAAERIYMWDLERENCIAQLNLPGSGASGDGAAPPVEHMAASCHSPLLYAADGGGTGVFGAGLRAPAAA